MSTVVTINQADIDAPKFPRDITWWLDFLPKWYVDRHHFKKSELEQRASLCANTTMDDVTRVVSIQTQNTKHAQAVADHLSRLRPLRSAVKIER